MATAYHFSTLGPMEIKTTSAGISSLRFIDEMPDTDAEADTLTAECIGQLDEYLEGHRTSFDLPLDLGTAGHFCTEVWRILCSIPYGKTRSYSSVAEVISKSTAGRAVGKVIGMNPIAIIIPCHRVIGKHGSLKGYAYGLEIKKALLQLENPSRFHSQKELVFLESMK